MDTIRNVQTDNVGYADVGVDPTFLEIIDPASLYVLSVVGEGGPCGAIAFNGRIQIRRAQPDDRVTITVAGKRLGMTDRLVRYPEDIARRNNAFWNQAWQ